MPDTVIITKAALEKLKKIHEEMEEMKLAVNCTAGNLLLRTADISRDLKYWIEDMEGY